VLGHEIAGPRLDLRHLVVVHLLSANDIFAADPLPLRRTPRAASPSVSHFRGQTRLRLGVPRAPALSQADHRCRYEQRGAHRQGLLPRRASSSRHRPPCRWFCAGAVALTRAFASPGLLIGLPSGSVASASRCRGETERGGQSAHSCWRSTVRGGGRRRTCRARATRIMRRAAGLLGSRSC
jgi:hypothetical protein